MWRPIRIRLRYFSDADPATDPTLKQGQLDVVIEKFLVYMFGLQLYWSHIKIFQFF